MSHSDLMTRERQEQIVTLVEQKGRLTVSEICELFEISEATVRRDLAALAGQNLILRVHGGAMKRRSIATTEAPLLQREDENREAKQRIGLATASLIKDGETVLLIGGSTGIAVARALHRHDKLTIVTDSLHVANELLKHKRHTIIMLGGTINPDEYAVRGMLSRIILEQLQVDKVVLGTKAISVDVGLSVETPEEAELWRSYMKIGQHIIVVTDSSKFEQSALIQVAPLDHIHTLITDSTLSQDVTDKIREKGVYVILR